MIIGKIHKGSGLGNQLHTYVMTRVLAADKGYDFGFVGIENFKGMSFLDLEWGKPANLQWHTEYPAGKLMVDSEHRLFEEQTGYYDPEVNFIEDGTVIDGYFQDERYFGHHLAEVNQWLHVEPLEWPEDLCVINFRGGEFQYVPELFLPPSYWQQAIAVMRNKQPELRFVVHTDDQYLASQFFPEFPVVVGMANNWRSIRFAKHLILSNSSFAILPALLNENAGTIIAPRYFSRYNTKQWIFPQNYYKKFTYI